MDHYGGRSVVGMMEDWKTPDFARSDVRTLIFFAGNFFFGWASAKELGLTRPFLVSCDASIMPI